MSTKKTEPASPLDLVFKELKAITSDWAMDAALLERTAGNSQDAWAQTYRLHAAVLRQCTSKIVRYCEPMDAANTVFNAAKSAVTSQDQS